MAYLMQFLFYGIPVLAVVLFVVCFVRYRTAKKKNKLEPGTYTEKEIKQRKLLVAVSGVIAGASLGFSFRYYMSGMVGNDKVKMISLNGVYPSAENIQNGTYPVITQFYAIYRADNANENIPVLMDWILSEEGQKIVEETRYVALSLGLI